VYVSSAKLLGCPGYKVFSVLHVCKVSLQGTSHELYPETRAPVSCSTHAVDKKRSGLSFNLIKELKYVNIQVQIILIQTDSS